MTVTSLCSPSLLSLREEEEVVQTELHKRPNKRPDSSFTYSPAHFPTYFPIPSFMTSSQMPRPILLRPLLDSQRG